MGDSFTVDLHPSDDGGFTIADYPRAPPRVTSPSPAASRAGTSPASRCSSGEIAVFGEDACPTVEYQPGAEIDDVVLFLNFAAP